MARSSRDESGLILQSLIVRSAAASRSGPRAFVCCLKIADRRNEAAVDA
jgi:hypothetical protein